MKMWFGGKSSRQFDPNQTHIDTMEISKPYKSDCFEPRLFDSVCGVMTIWVVESAHCFFLNCIHR